MKDFKVGSKVQFDDGDKCGIGKIISVCDDSYILELQGNLKGTGHSGFLYFHKDGMPNNYWYISKNSSTLKSIP